MALLASGIAYAHREILLRDKPRAMLAASPKGTVPVLVLGDESVIDESIDIMRWALARNDPEDWLLRADMALVATFDGTFKHHLDRYKYAVRYDVDPLVHRAAGLGLLTGLGQKLEGQHYLGGATPGFSDIAIFPFVRQFAGADAAWFASHAPDRLRAWLAMLTGSELFERAMVRIAPWVER